MTIFTWYLYLLQKVHVLFSDTADTKWLPKVVVIVNDSNEVLTLKAAKQTISGSIISILS